MISQLYSTEEYESHVEEEFALEDWISLEFAIYPTPNSNNPLEVESITSFLRQLIPCDSLTSMKALSKWLGHYLPFFIWRQDDYEMRRFTLSLICFSAEDQKEEEHFIEIIKEQLFPAESVAVSSFWGKRCFLKGTTLAPLFLSQATVVISQRRSSEEIKKNFSAFSQLLSYFFGSPGFRKQALVNDLLASRERTEEAKIFQIHAFLKLFMRRYPYDFDVGLLSELGHFLAISSSHFRKLRMGRHLSRLVMSHYEIKKKIRRAVLLAPENRHLFLRLLPTRLQTPFETKSVIGLFLGLSLFDKFEHFDEEHVLLTVQKWIPSLQLVQGSFLSYQNHQDEMLLFIYLELEKENGDPLTLKERQLLRRVLQQELKDRVQKLMPHLFSPRNEEQIMKNVILLSRELKDPSSLPHLMLVFEKQIETALIFNALLVFPATEGLDVQLCEVKDPTIEVSIERHETVGYFKDGYPKHALLFHVKVAKMPDIFRQDSSVNVYYARQKVYGWIEQAVGEVRDYDGGLILKQQELFSQLQEKFSPLLRERGDLLENFFYSIAPIERQAIIPLVHLETLFSAVLTSLGVSLKKRGAFNLDIQEKERSLFIVIRAESASVKKHLQEATNGADFGRALTTTVFSFQETIIVGYILYETASTRREQFVDSLKKVLLDWQKEREAFQVLRLNFIERPLAFDPRLAGDEVSKSILQMLYEGLMCLDSSGKACFALAKAVDLSSDHKTYTFSLRKCQWSNGMPVHAFDFEYAWKKVLSPLFQTPFAHFFFAIRNARDAKHGKCSTQEVGIVAEDAQTLRVELEHPLPYFLELIAHPVFSPINAAIDQQRPYWATSEGDSFVCNGPFYLKKNFGDEIYLLEKNPRYWDEKKIALHRIILTKTNERKALEMFKNDETDWLGRPFRPWDSLFEQAKGKGTSRHYLLDCVYWSVFNTRLSPFNSLKLRQAFSYAIDRKEMTAVLDDGIPAFSPLLPQHAHAPFVEQLTAEPEKARELFQEALSELGITAESLAPFQMIYPDGEKRAKTAHLLALQWKKILGIRVIPCGCPWSILFRKVTSGDFQIANIRWSSWVNDPLYTLEAFRWGEDALNLAKWENEEFRQLVERANHEQSAKHRAFFLEQAEKILKVESPIIALYYEKNFAIKKDSLNVQMGYGAFNFRDPTLTSVNPK